MQVADEQNSSMAYKQQQLRHKNAFFIVPANFLQLPFMKMMDMCQLIPGWYMGMCLINRMMPLGGLLMS